MTNGWPPMTYVFGDAEPEDSWDRDDPAGVLLDNLARRCAVLGEAVTFRAADDDRARLAEIVRVLYRLVDTSRHRSDRDNARVQMVSADVEYLRHRLGVA